MNHYQILLYGTLNFLADELLGFKDSEVSIASCEIQSEENLIEISRREARCSPTGIKLKSLLYSPFGLPRWDIKTTAAPSSKQ